MPDLDTRITIDRFVIIVGLACAVVGVLIARPWAVVLAMAPVCGAAYRLWRDASRVH